MFEKVDLLKSEVENYLPKYGTHSYEHTIRVYDICHQIGIKAKVDLAVLLPAALLHDIARGEDEHAKASAVKAKNILHYLGYEHEKIEKIIGAIISHSFTKKVKPNSIEAKILSDADKLDAIGAVGIYRAAMFCGEHKRSIKDFITHFHEKLLLLKDRLYTDEAKSIAETRHNFMVEFLNRLDEELIY